MKFSICWNFIWKWKISFDWCNNFGRNLLVKIKVRKTEGDKYGK